MTQPSVATGLIVESSDDYHAQSRQYMSSHQLADFRRCPRLWKQKRDGVIPDEDRPAYAFGRAAHTLILEGEEAFADAYTVADGPINPRTGSPFGKASKAYAEWAAEQAGELVAAEDYAVMAEMRASAFECPPARAILTADGQAEGVARTEYCGVPCQARVDWYSESTGITDIKTCDTLSYFEVDARRYGYLHQLAFYRAVLRLGGFSVSAVQIIAAEKRQPYRAGLWRVQSDSLDAAAHENAQALQYFAKCQQADCWPTGYEEPRELSL